jgi:hypothetical protein
MRGLDRASMLKTGERSPERQILRVSSQRVDCRVKPGNDEISGWPAAMNCDGKNCKGAPMTRACAT